MKEKFKIFKREFAILILILGTFLGVFFMSTPVQAATVSDNEEPSEEAEEEDIDTEIPRIKARIEGEHLFIQTYDNKPHIESVTVNGETFTDLMDGQMCIDIKELQESTEFIEIYCTDASGNTSKVYRLRNPYYVGEIESGQTDHSIDNPNSIEPTDPTYARGTVTEDIQTQTREFYTVEASGKVFYIVVDRESDHDNVYLLTEAGVNDLLNFTDYNGVDVQNGDVPMYQIPGTGYVNARPAETGSTASAKPEGTKGSDEDPEGTPLKNNNKSMLVVVVVVALVGVGYYFLKVKKRKEDLDDAEDIDSFDVPGGTEIEDGPVEYEEAPAEEDAPADDDAEEPVGYVDAEFTDPKAETRVVNAYRDKLKASRQ